MSVFLQSIRFNSIINDVLLLFHSFIQSFIIQSFIHLILVMMNKIESIEECSFIERAVIVSPEQNTHITARLQHYSEWRRVSTRPYGYCRIVKYVLSFSSFILFDSILCFDYPIYCLYFPPFPFLYMNSHTTALQCHLN